MRSLLLVLTMLGCGEVKATQVDAPAQTGDGRAVDTLAADTPAMTALDCASYCGAIQSACTGALAQYGSMQNCLDSCTTFTVGTAGATSGNTLACRVTHVDLAKSDPSLHCEHAGPAGGGVCGAAICDGFCTIVTAKCASDWPTVNGCLTGCSSFATTPPYAAPSAGNTVQCRLYHATMAATSPTIHCAHTTANSTVCQ